MNQMELVEKVEQLRNELHRPVNMFWNITGDKPTINLYEYAEKGKIKRIATFYVGILENRWHVEEVNFITGMTCDTNYELIGKVIDIIEKKVERKTPENTFIEELDLSTKAYNLVKRKTKPKGEYYMVADLLDHSEEEVKSWKTLGKKTFKEIKEKLLAKGWNFRK